MHILDDLAGLSSRAQDLLQRTGCRERPKLPRIPTDFLYVRDRAGRSVPAPLSLVVRREGFQQRYGGLRYNVRSTFTMRGERHDRITQWRYDLAGVPESRPAPHAPLRASDEAGPVRGQPVVERHRALQSDPVPLQARVADGPPQCLAHRGGVQVRLDRCGGVRDELP